MTGAGWNINTEGTPSNLGGFATYADQDVGGLRTGSSTVITFNVNVPQTGDYLMRVFDGSDAQASDVSGPTNIFARVDGGPPTEIWLPDAYNWVIWNYGTAQLHLTAGAHTISLSTAGANGAVTTGDAIIDKIDLTPQSASGAVIYEAEQAQLATAPVPTMPARASPERVRPTSSAVRTLRSGCIRLPTATPTWPSAPVAGARPG